MAAILVMASGLLVLSAVRSRRGAVLVLLVLAGWARMVVALPGELPEVHRAAAVVEGTVLAVDHRDDGAVLSVRAGSIKTASDPGPAGVRVRSYVPLDVRPGDRITATGSLSRPRPATNPGQFDYRRYLERTGIGFELVARSVEVTAGPAGPRGLVSATRSGLVSLLETLYGPRRAAVLRALVLGDRTGLPDEVAAAFSDAGLGHLLAVSGLHVGILVLSLGLAWMWLGLDGRGFFPFTVIILTLYGTVLGWPPSVLRASVMATIGLSPWKPGGLNSLCLAAVVCLALRPADILSPGFQMSFAATWSILALARRASRPAPWSPWRWVAGVAAVSGAAQLAVIPITAHHFGTVSLLSVPATVLALPPVTAALPLTLVSLLLGSWPPAVLLARAAASISGIAVDGLLAVATLTASMPGASLSVPQPPLAAVATYASGILLVSTRRPARRRLGALLLVMALALYWTVAWFPPGRLEVTFLDVGQGDAAVIRWAGGAILIDGGEGEPGCRGRNVVLPFLRHRGITALDVVVLSHAHSDHAGGLAAVVNEVVVGEIWDPGLAHPSGAYLGLLEAAALRGVRVINPAAGWVRVFPGGLTVEVLHPPATLMSGTSCDVNNSSLVLRVTLGEVSVLFTGDIHHEAEDLILRSGLNVAAHVLKVGHHGSDTSSTTAFLDRVRPAHAVIPVGENPYGHPGAGALERLVFSGAVLWRSDHHGAVTVVTDGRRLRVTPFTVAARSRDGEPNAPASGE